MSSSDRSVVRARDVRVARPGLRSFEFATFTAESGRVLAVLATESAAARDLLLAIAGLLRPAAGSLVVAGGEPRAGSHRVRLRSGIARLGIMSGVAGVPDALTVSEIVAHEWRIARRRGQHAPDTIDYLGEFGLATHAGQRAGDLASQARARLSAALAFAGDPRVALIDLVDASMLGLASSDALALVIELSALARRRSVAVVVSTTEPAVADAADAACALDIDAAEALAGEPSSI